MKSYMHLMNRGFHDFASRWWHYGLVVFLICSTAVVIYSNTFEAPFVFDDQHTIQENPKIRDLHHFYTPDILRSPRPLVDFTFALNYHFGKLRVFGYHLVNLFIHIGNGILVFFLSRMLYRKLSGADRPNSSVAALFAALIFIAHPIQTQAVTYIAQRYTSMAAFFYLGSVLGYILARDANTAGNRFSGCSYYLISFCCGLLAFLSKQNSASLPLAILLIEYVVYDRTWQGWKKKIGFIVFGVLLCGLFYAYNVGLFRQDIRLGTFLEDVSEKSRDFQQVGRWRYLCTQFNVIAIYVRLLVIPVQQNLDYLYPFKNGFFDGATPYAFVFLMALLGTAWWCRKKQPVLFLGVLWFFIALSVESSIIPIRDALFEHRLYLPMFGFAILVVSLMEGLLSKHRLWRYGALLVILVSLSVATYNRNIVWQDDVRLWSDVVLKKPSNYRALTNLGKALQDRGDLMGALTRYDSVLRIKPDEYLALYNKGVLLERIGKSEDALSVFQKVLRIRPDYSKALVNLGVATARNGKTDEAIAYLQRALTIQPQFLEAHLNLATVFANIGKLDAAVDHYQKALKQDPDNAKAHKNVGALLHLLSRYDEAVLHYHESLRLDPNNADTYLKLANSQQSLNLLNEAAASYKEVIRLNPKSVEAYTNLGAGYLQTGNREEAVKQFTEALKIKPDSVEAHANLGNALYSQGKMAEALQQFGIALRLKPDSKEILDNINKILHNQSNTNK